MTTLTKTELELKALNDQLRQAIKTNRQRYHKMTVEEHQEYATAVLEGRRHINLTKLLDILDKKELEALLMTMRI